MDIRHNISLRPFNTFGIEARALTMMDCGTEEELREAIGQIDGRRTFVLGGGSNVLFTRDFDGVVLRPLIGGIERLDDKDGCAMLRVGAGVVWDDFVSHCVGLGLHGVENLSGIPGNVGASPVQNIGAYGAEAGDAIATVEGVGIADGDPFELKAEECLFGYRNSIFKQSLRGQCVITRATYRLRYEGELNLGYGALREAYEACGTEGVAGVRQAVMSIRDSKLPDPKVLGNAGSFFKNPEVGADVAARLLEANPGMPHYDLGNGLVKIPAGWLIDQCGWKGRSLGPAAVHDKQALVLVNRGGAPGADIVRLSDAVREDVSRRFGIEISPEVNFI